MIGGIPSVIYGEKSDRVYLFVHGKSGCKEEAAELAKIICHMGWQVLGIDLPGHGERKSEADRFKPWFVVPELKMIMEYMKAGWNDISLYANSIGSWFSMQAFSDEPLKKSLFVSPILDMKKLIANMMTWAGVSAEELQQREIIETDFGETLEWKYIQYAESHAVTKWSCPTHILYAGHDNLTDRETVDNFTTRFGCRLTVAEDCEHWFHTPQQLEILDDWTHKSIY